MMHILDDRDNFLAVRYIGIHTKQDYDALYTRLVNKTRRYDTVRLYEEAVDFGPVAFLSTWIGIWHDIKYGPFIRLHKNCIVSDSLWARGMTLLFKAIRPVWPFSPTHLRFFEMKNRKKARQWIQKL